MIDNKISLVKYYLSTGNENEEHFVCITNIVEDPHECNNQHFKKDTNKFLRHYGRGVKNQITAIDFGYSAETPQ